jgi:phosphatidylinositol alpha-mannosyltransferase
MIIGYVLDDTLDKPDGVQQAMIVIAEKMRELGHEVHYIVPFTERQDLQNIHSVAKVISMKFNGNSIRTPFSSSRKQLKKLLTEIKFDVLHVQMPYSPVMSGKLIKLAPKSVKIVGTFHILPYNFLAKIGTKILGLYLWKNKKRFNKVFAVSRPAQEFMEKSFGLKGDITPNPVDYKFYRGFAGETLEVSKPKIVFVGRFDTRKGVKQLVRAYENLPNREDVELIMCGKGPLLQELRDYSDIKGLKIFFPGFVDNETKAKYLSNAQIAVFPSTAGESFGIVLTEAMSAGAGVTIGGNNPGYASVLDDFKGTLFNPNNRAEFTAKLTEFLDNPDKTAQIGAMQHANVKKYDVDTVVDRLIKEAYS